MDDFDRQTIPLTFPQTTYTYDSVASGSEGAALYYLTSQFGGALPVDAGQHGRPISGYLPLVIATDAPSAGRALPGTAVVEAEPQSLLGFLAGRIATVMLRESGF